MCDYGKLLAHLIPPLRPYGCPLLIFLIFRLSAQVKQTQQQKQKQNQKQTTICLSGFKYFNMATWLTCFDFDFDGVSLTDLSFGQLGQSTLSLSLSLSLSFPLLFAGQSIT